MPGSNHDPRTDFGAGTRNARPARHARSSSRSTRDPWLRPTDPSEHVGAPPRTQVCTVVRETPSARAASRTVTPSEAGADTVTPLHPAAGPAWALARRARAGNVRFYLGVGRGLDAARGPRGGIGRPPRGPAPVDPLRAQDDAGGASVDREVKRLVTHARRAHP